jgi:hypothetical protein
VPVRVERNVAKRITLRLLTLVVILAVAVWCTHAISHWHAQTYTEQNCQLCHIGHSVIPQTAVTTAVEAPSPITRFIPNEKRAPELQPVRTLSSPRAPPTA